MSGSPGWRPWSVRLHRWAALLLGGWFALAGLTGAVLVWHSELDRALNPGWFAPVAACDRAEPAAPVAAALALYGRSQAARPTQVMRPETAGAPYIVWSGAGEARRQHFIDVRCGRYLGGRDWGAARFDRRHIVPALYELHRALLAGDTGHVVVGVGGLWLLGIVLTGLANAWPRTASRAIWKRVLAVKWNAPQARRFFDLHRAAGLWATPFLVLMSLTGVYLCFPGPARALVSAFLPTAPAWPAGRAGGMDPAPAPDTLARRAEARWPAAAWTRLQLPSSPGGGYEVRLLQPAEWRKDTGDTRMRFDAAGNVLDVVDPIHALAGDGLIQALFPLHSGEALGMPGRAAWTVFAVLPMGLFGTGVWLWTRRRRGVRGARMAPGRG